MIYLRICTTKLPYNLVRHTIARRKSEFIIFRALESLKTEGRNSKLWESVSLAEVIKTLEDLIEYFAPPGEELGKYIKFF